MISPHSHVQEVIKRVTFVLIVVLECGKREFQSRFTWRKTAILYVSHVKTTIPQKYKKHVCCLTASVDGIFCYKQKTTQNDIGMCSLWREELLYFVFLYMYSMYWNRKDSMFEISVKCSIWYYNFIIIAWLFN